MLTIIKYTFKELLYKKIFISTLLLALLYLGLYGGALYMVFQRGGTPPDLLIRASISSQLVGAGLYFSTFIVAFLTVLGSVSMVTYELETGILYGILSKPITRTEYMLGKFLGLALMLIIFSLFLIGAVLGLNLLMAGEVLYHFKLISIIKGALIYFLIPLTLLSLVFYLSTILKPLATGIVVIMNFMLGIIGGFLEQIGMVINKQELVDMGILASLFSPVDSIYRKFFSFLYDAGQSPIAILANGPFGSGHPPSIWMIFYSVGYILLFIILALRKFNKMDL
ncbi:MAG: hypothetical protein VR72_21940 [Clostridiaceae bacterium BRH_c20a]|nr:MAG: hypothetical protein VR72_21940 [Clostridiaceae bacterium BRH_c20a]